MKLTQTTIKKAKAQAYSNLEKTRAKLMLILSAMIDAENSGDELNIRYTITKIDEALEAKDL